MSTLEIIGGTPLRGRIRVPGDKSISHRALILAALANGTSVIRGLSDGDDVRRTADGLRCLGAAVHSEHVTGGRRRLRESEVPLDVGNSGTTMRLLAGVCASFPWLTHLVGDDSISRRPMDRVAEPLRLMGAEVSGHLEHCFPPLVVRGGDLKGIDYELPVPSSQVKGAVLLAGLGARGETVVREEIRSRAHTEEMLAACGADVEVSDDGLTVRLRPSELEPFALDVPGDPSNAAFWVVAACIVPGSEVVVENVYLGPARGGFIDVLRRMGADVQVDWHPPELGTSSGPGSASSQGQTADIRASYSALHGTDIGGDEMPGVIDEVPVLAVAAAAAHGVTTITGARELRIKETDRILAITSELQKLGGKVESLGDGLVVTGGALHGGTVTSHGDHRMAMALAVAGLASGLASGPVGARREPIRIECWEAVVTSYPGFASDLRSLT